MVYSTVAVLSFDQEIVLAIHPKSLYFYRIFQGIQTCKLLKHCP